MVGSVGPRAELLELDEDCGQRGPNIFWKALCVLHEVPNWPIVVPVLHVELCRTPKRRAKPLRIHQRKLDYGHYLLGRSALGSAGQPARLLEEQPSPERVLRPSAHLGLGGSLLPVLQRQGPHLGSDFLVPVYGHCGCGLHKPKALRTARAGLRLCGILLRLCDLDWLGCSGLGGMVGQVAFYRNSRLSYCSDARGRSRPDGPAKLGRSQPFQSVHRTGHCQGLFGLLRKERHSLHQRRQRHLPPMVRTRGRRLPNGRAHREPITAQYGLVHRHDEAQILRRRAGALPL